MNRNEATAFGGACIGVGLGALGGADVGSLAALLVLWAFWSVRA